MSARKSNSHIAKLTDPISELRNTAEILYTQKGRGEAVSNVIYELLKREKYQSSAIFTAYSINNNRCSRLLGLVSQARSDEFDDDLANECLNAINAVAEVFSPNHFNQGFGGTVNSVLREKHITALQFSAPHIKRIHPINVINHGDIVECLSRIEAGIQEIVEQKNFPVWAADPLIRGANELYFILNNLSFFGQDALSDALFKIMSHATGFVSLQKAGKVVTVSIFALCTALVGVADVITAPKNITEGLQWWQSTANSAIEHAVPLLSAPPLRIEGPKPVSGSGAPQAAREPADKQDGDPPADRPGRKAVKGD